MFALGIQAVTCQATALVPAEGISKPGTQCWHARRIRGSVWKRAPEDGLDKLGGNSRLVWANRVSALSTQSVTLLKTHML